MAERDGSKPKSRGTGEAGDPQAREGYQGRSGGGESAGGAYPNPHARTKAKDGFMGHGGQSEMAYHGAGRLGERKVGDNPNAPAASDDSD